MPPAEYLLPAKVGFVSATGMLDKIQKSPHKTCYTANTDSYIALLVLLPAIYVATHTPACLPKMGCILDKYKLTC